MPTIPHRERSLLTKSLLDYFNALTLRSVSITDAPNSFLAVAFISLIVSLQITSITVIAELIPRKSVIEDTRMRSLLFFPLLLIFSLISGRVDQYLLSTGERPLSMLPLAYALALSLVHAPFFYTFKYVTKFASSLFFFFQYLISFFYFRSSIQGITDFKDERESFVFSILHTLMLILYVLIVLEVFF
jgi:hypothetical protein